MTVVEAPWVTVDAMFWTFVMPAIASSTGRVIWVSISAGAAPLRVTVTATRRELHVGKVLDRQLGVGEQAHHDERDEQHRHRDRVPDAPR